MAGNRRSGLNPLFVDIEQILQQAQHRWLRPAEICEILRNYYKFRVAPEQPNKPPSGSLFLFNGKVLRYFRKDGHNWRKKKDGKTVKEAHEKLKGSKSNLLPKREDGEDTRNSNLDSAACSNSSANLSHVPSQLTDYVGPNGTPKAEYEVADSVYLKQNSMQQIMTKQFPDTTLSLRCSSMDLG